MRERQPGLHGAAPLGHRYLAPGARRRDRRSRCRSHRCRPTRRAPGRRGRPALEAVSEGARARVADDEHTRQVPARAAGAATCNSSIVCVHAVGRDVLEAQHRRCSPSRGPSPGRTGRCGSRDVVGVERLVAPDDRVRRAGTRCARPALSTARAQFICRRRPSYPRAWRCSRCPSRMTWKRTMSGSTESISRGHSSNQLRHVCCLPSRTTPAARERCRDRHREVVAARGSPGEIVGEMPSGRVRDHQHVEPMVGTRHRRPPDRRLEATELGPGRRASRPRRRPPRSAPPTRAPPNAGAPG